MKPPRRLFFECCKSPDALAHRAARFAAAALATLADDPPIDASSRTSRLATKSSGHCVATQLCDAPSVASVCESASLVESSPRV